MWKGQYKDGDPKSSRAVMSSTGYSQLDFRGVAAMASN